MPVRALTSAFAPRFGAMLAQVKRPKACPNGLLHPLFTLVLLLAISSCRASARCWLLAKRPKACPHGPGQNGPARTGSYKSQIANLQSHRVWTGNCPLYILSPMTRLALVLLLASSTLGCLGGRDHLLGFPDADADSPSDRADRAQEALRKTEQLIRESKNPILEAEWKRAAVLRLIDVYVALSNDEIGASTGLDPQGTVTRRPPLFLYPRATSPLIAEPAKGPGDAPQYILPLVLNRSAFERPRTAEAWLGYPLAALFFAAKQHELPQTGRDLYRQLGQHFHFVLMPRDPRHPGEVSLDHDPERYLPTRLTDEGRNSERMHLRDDAIEILFRLPTADLAERWKTIEAAQGEAVREELFDLRLLPRLALDPATASAGWRPIAEALSAGRWTTARDFLRERVRSGGPWPEKTDAAALAQAVESFSEVFLHFATPLESVGRLARDLAKDPTSPVALGSLLQAVESFLEENDCPGPILLDRPDPAKRSFSFIACGDLQYHGNGSKLFAF